MSTPASGGYKWYVLIMLTIMYTFNFIDRQILVILQEPIKAELGLTDTQLGLLTGLAFAALYVVLGIPIARYADLNNRKNVVAISLAVWSAMTAISGRAVNFTYLLFARIGVGIGEAGGSPPAHSIISDYFPPEKRATALSIYSTGIYIGILLGYIVGGVIARYYGWRMAFYALGIPGIIFSLVVYFTIKEPVKGIGDRLKAVKDPKWSDDELRHQELKKIIANCLIITFIIVCIIAVVKGLLVIAVIISILAVISILARRALRNMPTKYEVIEEEQLESRITSTPSIKETIRHLFSKKTFIYCAFAAGFHTFTTYGVGNFLPPFLHRIHNVELVTISIVLGLTTGVGGFIGTYLGGYLADKKRSIDMRWYMWVPLIAGLMNIIPALILYLTPNANLAMVMTFFTGSLTALYLGPGLAVTHSLVSPKMRAFASSVFFFILNFIGLGFGPLLVGIMSDVLTPQFGEESLRWAFMLTFIPGIIAMILLIQAAKHYNDDLKSVGYTFP